MTDEQFELLLNELREIKSVCAEHTALASAVAALTSQQQLQMLSVCSEYSPPVQRSREELEQHKNDPCQFCGHHSSGGLGRLLRLAPSARTP
jgi:hypothetical protein